jgi:nucleoside-diphosphate-sugar epimerase
LDVAVKGMVNVLDACIRAGVGELVLASSSEVYQTPPAIPADESAPLSVPDPHNPRYSYGGGKIISERMALNYGREHFERVLIFRPHNVFGPNMGWEHVIPQFVTKLLHLTAKSGGQEALLPIQGTGDQSRSFIYIDDFVAGLMVLLNRGEHLNIYNIGTTEEVTIRDLAHRVAHCLGVRIRIAPGPEAVGGTPRRCPDISKIRKLGFEPRCNFDEALSRTVQWYAEHPQPAGASDALKSAKLFLEEKK